MKTTELPLPGLPDPYTGSTSPITFMADWDPTVRMVIMLLMTVFGCTGNGFFIASFFVNKKLHKPGNAFLGNIGVADMLVTCAVIPTSIIVLLSGKWDSPGMCQAQLFVSRLSITVTSLSYMFVARENLLRFYGIRSEYNEEYTPKYTSYFISMIWIFSVVITSIGSIYDYDFCARQSEGEILYRIITGIFVTIVPILVTIYAHLITILCIRYHYRKPLNKRIRDLDQNASLARLNMFTYYLFLGFWAPYTISVLFFFFDTNNRVFYLLAWVGISRSCVVSFIYGFANREFKKSFLYILNCCFLKQRTRLEHRRCAADIRPRYKNYRHRPYSKVGRVE